MALLHKYVTSLSRLILIIYHRDHRGHREEIEYQQTAQTTM
jgi:hypothetical protein